jgi:hypothetical protein
MIRPPNGIGRGGLDGGTCRPDATGSLIDAYSGDRMVRIEPFDEIEWDLGRLWADQEADWPAGVGYDRT